MTKRDLLLKVKAYDVKSAYTFNKTELEEILYIMENYSKDQKATKYMKSGYRKTKRGLVAFLEAENKAPLKLFNKGAVTEKGGMTNVVIESPSFDDYMDFYDNKSIDELIAYL